MSRQKARVKGYSSHRDSISFNSTFPGGQQKEEETNHRFWVRKKHVRNNIIASSVDYFTVKQHFCLQYNTNSKTSKALLLFHYSNTHSFLSELLEDMPHNLPTLLFTYLPLLLEVKLAVPRYNKSESNLGKS